VIFNEPVLPAVDPGEVAAAVAPAALGAVALAALSGRATSPPDAAAVALSALFRLPLPQAVNATSVAHAAADEIVCHLLSILPPSAKPLPAAALARAESRGGRRARNVLPLEAEIERAGR